MPGKNKCDHGDTGDGIERKTYQIVHDWRDDTPLSATIVTTISSVRDKPVTDLPPLYDTIDPDALDVLFQPSQGGCSRNEGELSFPFDEVSVTVHASGEIEFTFPIRDRSE